jgi:hypothetical protein
MNTCLSVTAATIAFTAAADDGFFLFPGARVAGATVVAACPGTIRRITTNIIDAQSLLLSVWDPTQLFEFTGGSVSSTATSDGTDVVTNTSGLTVGKWNGSMILYTTGLNKGLARPISTNTATVINHDPFPFFTKNTDAYTITAAGMRDGRYVNITGVVGATQIGNPVANLVSLRHLGVYSTRIATVASTVADVTGGELLHEWQCNTLVANGVTWPLDYRDLKLDCSAGMCLRFQQPGGTAITGRIRVYVEFDPWNASGPSA